VHSFFLLIFVIEAKLPLALATMLSLWAIVYYALALKLSRSKEKRPEGAPKFAIEVYEVSEQLMKIFCDSGWLKLRILATDRAICATGCGSAVAARCAGRLGCLSLGQGAIPRGW
jgi:hypothetical protein